MLAWMDVIAAAVGDGLDFTPNGETKGPFGVSKRMVSAVEKTTIYYR